MFEQKPLVVEQYYVGESEQKVKCAARNAVIQRQAKALQQRSFHPMLLSLSTENKLIYVQRINSLTWL